MRETNYQMNKIRKYVLLLVCLGCASPVFAGDAGDAVKTEWKVHGSGWLLNRQLNKQLRALMPEDQRLHSNDVEDATTIILSLMQQRGFLDAKVLTHLTGEIPGETSEPFETELLWDRNLETFLKQDVQVETVHFEVQPGPVFYFKELKIKATGGLEEKLVRAFFFKDPMLFQSRKVRLFNPSRFQKGCRDLEAFLALQGHQDAIVIGTIESEDWQTGAVCATVEILPGPLHLLESILIEGETPAFVQALSFEPWLHKSYSKEVAQDLHKWIRNAFFEHGFPHAKVTTELKVLSEGDPVTHQLLFHIESGESIRLGQVRVAGLGQTRESFVRKKMNLLEGEPFNPVELDRNRLTLSRTGLFDKVNVSVLPDDGDRYDVKFDLQERYPWTIDMLAGWGSYEQARMGVTIRRANLWGQAHQLNLRGVASLKSVFGESVYVIPDIRRSGVNFSSRAFSLDREELSFDRKERGSDVSITKRFERFRLDSTLIYTLESLESLDRQSRMDLGDENSKVGSLSLRLSHDRRNNVIVPQSGYRLYSNLEWADQRIGGEVNYWAGEVGYAHHGSIASGLFWHFGFSSGMVFTPDGQENFIPNNKLYYPGGDDSIRGYQRGEASPRDAQGFLVGGAQLQSGKSGT